MPSTNFEGLDTFTYSVSDGFWTNGPSLIEIYVVAEPTLVTECDPFGPAIQLHWSVDSIVQSMENNTLNITNFAIYRSTNSTELGENIFNEPTWGITNYWDADVVPGVTYYYTINFQSSLYSFQSPFSDQVGNQSFTNNNFLNANAYWDVVTNMDTPSEVTVMQAPLSNQYPLAYPFLYPLPNTNWTSDTTWSNYTTFVIPTNTPFSDVKYSIAIDNQYWLSVNNTNVGTGTDDGLALWKSFETFPTNILHYGTNKVGVIIQDTGGSPDLDYFSMVITTNTCGWQSDQDQ
jgi:hypothetical protein